MNWKVIMVITIIVLAIIFGWKVLGLLVLTLLPSKPYEIQSYYELEKLRKEAKEHEEVFSDPDDAVDFLNDHLSGDN